VTTPHIIALQDYPFFNEPRQTRFDSVFFFETVIANVLPLRIDNLSVSIKELIESCNLRLDILAHMTTSKIEGKLTCLHNFGSANLSCNTNTTCKPIFTLIFFCEIDIKLFASLEEAILSPAVSELVAQSCISMYCNLWNICEMMRHYFSDCSLDQGTFKKVRLKMSLG
jgi:hypothetical protein